MHDARCLKIDRLQRSTIVSCQTSIDNRQIAITHRLPQKFGYKHLIYNQFSIQSNGSLRLFFQCPRNVLLVHFRFVLIGTKRAHFLTSFLIVFLSFGSPLCWLGPRTESRGLNNCIPEVRLIPTSLECLFLFKCIE